MATELLLQMGELSISEPPVTLKRLAVIGTRSIFEDHSARMVEATDPSAIGRFADMGFITQARTITRTRFLIHTDKPNKDWMSQLTNDFAANEEADDIPLITKVTGMAGNIMARPYDMQGDITRISKERARKTGPQLPTGSQIQPRCSTIKSMGARENPLGTSEQDHDTDQM